MAHHSQPTPGKHRVPTLASTQTSQRQTVQHSQPIPGRRLKEKPGRKVRQEQRVPQALKVQQAPPVRPVHKVFQALRNTFISAIPRLPPATRW